MKRGMVFAGVVVVLAALVVVYHSRKSDDKSPVAEHKKHVDSGETTSQKSVSVESVPEQTIANDAQRIGSVSKIPENEIAKQPKPSAAVRTLTGADASYVARMEALRALEVPLSDSDIEALMAWLGEPTPEELPLGALEYNSIKNDVVELLLAQPRLPDGLGNLLVDIYNDPGHDEIWRNYALQFMAPFYDRHSKAMAGSDAAVGAEDLELVEQTLWHALDERNNSNAGTALLGLHELSDEYPRFAKEDIRVAMIDLASDGAASEASRLTALRLCGEGGYLQALDVAIDMAKTGETTLLRCVAIATIGDLGSAEDGELLRELAGSEDVRIQRIARQSLERVLAR